MTMTAGRGVTDMALARIRIGEDRVDKAPCWGLGQLDFFELYPFDTGFYLSEGVL